MACRPYNTGRCLQLRLFNCPNFGVHFIPVCDFYTRTGIDDSDDDDSDDSGGIYFFGVRVIYSSII